MHGEALVDGPRHVDGCPRQPHGGAVAEVGVTDQVRAGGRWLCSIADIMLSTPLLGAVHVDFTAKSMSRNVIIEFCHEQVAA